MRFFHWLYDEEAGLVSGRAVVNIDSVVPGRIRATFGRPGRILCWSVTLSV